MIPAHPLALNSERKLDERRQRALTRYYHAAGAGGVAVGGGHVDLVDAGRTVVIGGVSVANGDLIHADRHGAVKIPLRLAADLPAAIRAHEAVERRIIDLCRSAEFTTAALADLRRELTP